ncbi:uncharacterized protein PV09_01946 [Verruconis gallopava]|uniref:Uncharacterized protein n=1 Tax=Verruconis gallopava TaxID=253628 RepID=A0A0D2AKH3_9PEZI|nr:uncharacterized protein PV09_01946 [Verruconis gallopava]KIW07055.1 hypothetical protein PV09_01946 [Verruconis gallopava]
MAERAMRNMHVPAYWPVEFGVQVDEKRGVVVDAKNVIAIVSISIIPDEDISAAFDEEEVAIDMADIVLDAAEAADIVIPDIVLMSIL